MNLNGRSNLAGRRMGIDEPSVLEDNRPDRTLPGHSTPKRPKPCAAAHEPQSQDYRGSPIQLTQDTNSEVVWDWQSPITTVKSRGKLETSTPKRSRVGAKKRNSNSPLIKPIKKRIIKPSSEERASLEKWTSDLLALDAKISSAASQETVKENIENNEISDELVFDDFDVEEAEPLIVLADSPPGGSKTPPQAATVQKVSRSERESLEDLFDDSIGEESMLRCSQEIEEKLNIGPPKRSSSAEVRSFGLTRVDPPRPSPRPLRPPTQSPRLSSRPAESPRSTIQPPRLSSRPAEPPRSSARPAQPSKSVAKPPEPSRSVAEPLKTVAKPLQPVASTSTPKFKKHNSEPIDPRASRNAARNIEPVATIDLDDFDIPDDSFDEILLAACDQFDAKLTEPKRFNLDTSAKKSTFQSKIATSGRPPNQSRGAAAQPSTVTTQDFSSDRKFFKTRNRSDSSFDTSSRSAGNLSGKIGRSVSTSTDLRRSNSSDQGHWRGRGGNNNLNDFDRRVGGSGRAPGTQSNPCTAEEIRRKHQEAKMRLEAKKRKLQNSRVNVKR